MKQRDPRHQSCCTKYSGATLVNQKQATSTTGKKLNVVVGETEVKPFHTKPLTNLLFWYGGLLLALYNCNSLT